MTEHPSLVSEVRELQAQVQWLLARIEEPDYEAPAATSPADGCCWRDLPDDAAASLWSVVAEWVDWLQARYGLDDVIPPCWDQHPALIEELTALHHAWTSAYTMGSGSWDPLTWHEALDRAQQRLRAWDRRGCLSGTHREDLDAAIDGQGLSLAARYRLDVKGTEGVVDGSPRLEIGVLR